MYQGILAINKPRGMTSHDVVSRLRRLLHMRRIGHTGTLDPDVDGVLVVCLGQATKLVEVLMDSPKSYIGEVTFGYSTETEDASGDVVATKPVDPPIADADIDVAMQKFLGEIQQIPPYYSAVKVKGKRLYEYARQGIEVERPSRRVHIESFKRVDESIYDEATGTQCCRFQVDCSKGTYVRTLAVDLGEAFGYPAHMSDLTRTETSGCTLDDAYTLEQIEAMVSNGQIKNVIKKPIDVVDFLPQLIVPSEQEFAVLNGQVLDKAAFGQPISQPTALIIDHQLAAIYQSHPAKEGYIKPFKMFMNQQSRGGIE